METYHPKVLATFYRDVVVCLRCTCDVAETYRKRTLRCRHGVLLCGVFLVFITNKSFLWYYWIDCLKWNQFLFQAVNFCFLGKENWNFGKIWQRKRDPAFYFTLLKKLSLHKWKSFKRTLKLHNFEAIFNYSTIF